MIVKTGCGTDGSICGTNNDGGNCMADLTLPLPSPRDLNIVSPISNLPPDPGQSMTWEAAIFITIKVVSFCDADFDPVATKM